MNLLVVFAVSPCPFALIKHLEHERRQITASNTGVLVFFFLFTASPQGTLAVFQRTAYDMGAVTVGPWGPDCCSLTGWPSWVGSLSPQAPSCELGIGLHLAPLTSCPATSDFAFSSVEEQAFLALASLVNNTQTYKLMCIKLIGPHSSEL